MCSAEVEDGWTKDEGDDEEAKLDEDEGKEGKEDCANKDTEKEDDKGTEGCDDETMDNDDDEEDNGDGTEKGSFEKSCSKAGSSKSGMVRLHASRCETCMGDGHFFPFRSSIAYELGPAETTRNGPSIRGPSLPA